LQKVNQELKRFNYLNGEINAAYHEAARRLHLSDSGMMILYIICSSDGECLLSDLVRLSGLNKQTVNSALRKLEQEEIVFLKAFDGRKKLVCLTAKGKSLAESTVARIIQFENEIFLGWTVEERRLYIEMTQKYLDAFQDKIKAL